MKKIIVSIIVTGLLLITSTASVNTVNMELYNEAENFEMQLSYDIRYAIPMADIYVDDDADIGWYDATHVNTIQGGINAVNDDDTIYVYSGTYAENIVVDKSITLRGEDKDTTIIDGGKSGDVVQIYADRVTISGFTIQNGNGYGIVLKSTDNTILNNIIKMNIKDIKDTNEDNLFSSNLFLYNAQTSLITFDTGGIKKNLNEEVSFSVSMFNVNGDPFYSNDYNIYIRPTEPMSISKYGNTITGSFTVKKSGIYSLVVEIKDMNNNIVKNKWTFFVNLIGSATVRYYFRGVEPTHGQPAGSDAKSMLFTPPSEEESWNCSYWVQNSPDEIPENPISILTGVDINCWYKFGQPGPLIRRHVIGIQKFVSWGTQVIKSHEIPIAGEYTWINTKFNMFWPMVLPKSWYWLSLKLIGTHFLYPHWMTEPNQPAYADFTYIFCKIPGIKSISNPNIILLSATTQASNTNNAQIILEGMGTTNLIVKMPETTSLDYSAELNGVECNNENYHFTQVNGELSFTLHLGSEHSEHTLYITGS